MFQDKPYGIIEEQDAFQPREVGLTHPDLESFIRLNDAGDIEIMGDEGVGIIIHSRNRSITLVADSIKFATKDIDGLRWNRHSFNPKSYQYHEPTLLPYDQEDHKTLYRGVEDYLDG